jgi:ABC-type multidrug transport system fused ATPase/permease subunit
MKDGQIVESGTHAELLANGQHYAELHKTLEH